MTTPPSKISPIEGRRAICRMTPPDAAGQRVDKWSDNSASGRNAEIACAHPHPTHYICSRYPQLPPVNEEVILCLMVLVRRGSPGAAEARSNKLTDDPA